MKLLNFLLVFLWGISLFFIQKICAKTPITASSFTYFTGHEIIEPQNFLYYAYPSNYLFSYDNYSQKIKSVDIETGVYNVFHQVNFEVGQMLFLPQGQTYIRNLTAGNQMLQWNYLTSFALQPVARTLDMTDFILKPFYSTYNQFTPNPNFYYFIFNGSKIEILDFNNTIVSQVSKDGIGLKSACSFPEQHRLITGGSDGVVRIWNFTAGLDLNNTFNFSQTHTAPVDFLERSINSRIFLSADNTERKLMIWSLDNKNLSRSYNVSFGDSIQGVRSVSNKTAVIYGTESSIDYVNVQTGSLIRTITLVNMTIKALEVLPLAPNTLEERIAVLCSDRIVRVYVLNPSSGISSYSKLFTPVFPQFNNILFARSFKFRNSATNIASSIMAIVSDSYNKTVYFVNEDTMTNVTNFSFSSEIRGLFIVMSRYMPIFQDMMMVWHGNSYSIYKIEEDWSVILYDSFVGTYNITDLNLVYVIGMSSYPFVSMVDTNNMITILNSTGGKNLSFYKETDGVKFFCNQNYLTNFAYILNNGTMRIKSVDSTSFVATRVAEVTTEINHPGVNACFSKNIVSGGFFMTSNKTDTITYQYNGVILMTTNFTNVTSLITEGNALFTQVKGKEKDNKLYEAVLGGGIVTSIPIGFAPSSNGFFFQFIENFYYMINQKELAKIHFQCPFGTTQSNSLLGACFPKCDKFFITLTNSSCSKSCLSGTYATPIVDSYNNFTAQLCQNYNSTILNCKNGIDLGNYSIKCTKCDQNYFLLETNSTSTKYNYCAAYKLDGRLTTSINPVFDGTGTIFKKYNTKLVYKIFFLYFLIHMIFLSDKLKLNAKAKKK